jgi:outer membrane protein TolC
VFYKRIRLHVKVWASKKTSGRGLPQSKTLPRWLKPSNFSPGFGLRQPSAALFGCLIAVNLITGCAHFVPQPISPEKSAAQLEARRLDDVGLKKFLEENLGHKSKSWPQQNWNFQELTLVAFYFHPSLEVARAQWRLAEAGIKTAGGRPNPTLTVTPEYNTTTLVPSPWGPSVSLDVPIETMGKRSKRIAAAEKVSDAARFNFMSAAWQIRRGVRTSLLDFQIAGRRAELLSKQFAAQQQILKRLQQRLEAGAISRSELTLPQIALNRTQMDFSDAQSKQAEARSRLAEALGVSAAALEDVKFDLEFSTSPVEQLTSAEARCVALISRSDILAALADYAASEADVRLEIAKQFPDVHLNPGYQFDQGDNKWLLGLTVELPILNQNQGAIAEAEARRKLSAAKFIALQAQIIGEIDRAVAGWRVAQAQVQAGKELLAVQQQQEKSAEAQVQAGAADGLDLLNAQLEFNSASLVQLDSAVKTQAALGVLEDALQLPADSIAAVIEKISTENPKGKKP